MKDSYIDKYGLDSIPKMEEASRYGEMTGEKVIFMTLNQEVIKDREELENFYKIKIVTPKEMVEE